MLIAVKRWLEPPHFEGDEAKTAQASVLNSLSIDLMAALLLAIFILVPLFIVEKLEVLVLLILLLLGVVIGRVLIFRGQLRLGSAVIVSMNWIGFIFLTLFSGGSDSPAMVYLAATILIAGYVLSTRASTRLLALTILVGLANTYLQSHGLVLPTVVVFSPLSGWLAFGLGLLFMFGARDLFMRKLQTTLADTQ